MLRSTRTFLAFEINALIDANAGSEFSYERAADAVDSGVIFDALSSMGADLSLLDAGDRAVILKEWQEFRIIRARKKFGVEKTGLCLILAFVIEGIQQQLLHR